MSNVDFVGRAAPQTSRCRDSIGGQELCLREKTWLDLTEAAAVARLSVEDVKRAIRAGELRAERQGWVQIHRGDLNDFLHKI